MGDDIGGVIIRNEGEDMGWEFTGGNPNREEQRNRREKKIRHEIQHTKQSINNTQTQWNTQFQQ